MAALFILGEALFKKSSEPGMDMAPPWMIRYSTALSYEPMAGGTETY